MGSDKIAAGRSEVGRQVALMVKGRRRGGARRLLAALAASGVLAGTLAGCGGAPSAAPGPAKRILVVAGENQYGNVAAQVGGRWVKVDSVESNPSVDPHTYEPSPAVASEVAAARLVIQNGVGYDPFLNRLESASSGAHRRVIDVQELLGLSASTPNPHLWYDPRTMPAVADAIATDLGRISPAHAAQFTAAAARFVAALAPWNRAITAFRHGHPAATAVSTEPVADYLLSAMGIANLAPFRFQADVMNGVDPTPQDIGLMRRLLAQHRVDFLAYNEQVVDPLTASLRSAAVHAGVPVVAVYETMPVPGYDYQTWMLAETHAIARAVTQRASTTHL